MTVTQYRVIAPPVHLMVESPIPAWAGGDWAAVIDLAEARRVSLDQCNADKRAIRDYVRHARETFESDDLE